MAESQSDILKRIRNIERELVAAGKSIERISAQIVKLSERKAKLEAKLVKPEAQPPLA